MNAKPSPASAIDGIMRQFDDILGKAVSVAREQLAELVVRASPPAPAPVADPAGVASIEHGGAAHDGAQDGATDAIDEMVAEAAPLLLKRDTALPAGLPAVNQETDLFTEVVDVVLKAEGGYSDHKSDKGGATKYGITIGTLSDWLRRPATKAEVAALDIDTARKIYHDNYWRPIRGADLPPMIAGFIFDMAVNSGVTAAGKLLQRSLGETTRAAIKVDGKIGPATLGMMQAMNPDDVDELAAYIHANRQAFYERIKDGGVFQKGWRLRLGRMALFVGKLAARRALGI